MRVIVTEAEGELEYVIHQFKDFVGALNSCLLEWDGQSPLAPSDSVVWLQIYNYVTPAWENVDSDNATGADTDFELTSPIADLTDYKSPSSYITCRVWQRDT